MGSRDFRDDLLYAAYATHIGYTIKPRQGRDFIAGIPHDSLTFERDNGRVVVWDTARGWRASAVVNGMFTKPVDSEFHAKLLNALEAGLKL